MCTAERHISSALAAQSRVSQCGRRAAVGLEPSPVAAVGLEPCVTSSCLLKRLVQGAECKLSPSLAGGRWHSVTWPVPGAGLRLRRVKVQSAVTNFHLTVLMLAPLDGAEASHPFLGARGC